MSSPSVPSSVHVLHVALQDSAPLIWRRVAVPSDTPLDRLHLIVQIVMGWEDAHLHQFIVGETYYSDPAFGLDVADERAVRLDHIAPQPDDGFVYDYDFGDGWAHEIRVEAVQAAAPDARYPRCLDGARACPPEDVGGIWGYDDFLDALRDAQHPEHDAYREWIGGAFDPDAFDCAGVDVELKRLR